MSQTHADASSSSNFQSVLNSPVTRHLPFCLSFEISSCNSIADAAQSEPTDSLDALLNPFRIPVRNDVPGYTFWTWKKQRSFRSDRTISASPFLVRHHVILTRL
jgi:hypothetical protein